MNVYELKEYIINNNKTEDVLIGIGCTNIKPHSKEYRFSTPLCPNATATRLKKENLKYRSFSADDESFGDIVSLTMKINNLSFSSSMSLIHKILGLRYNGVYKKEEKQKHDMLDIFKKAKNNTYRDYDLEELKIYHEDVFREYISIPYIGWVREGIMPYTQKVFGIGYNKEHDRVCVPWRYWSGNKNDFTGVVGRTLNEDYDILNIPKYFPLIKFPKSMNIFGLQENYLSIQESGEVIIVESEKAVMMLHSLMKRNAVALGGHALSDEQIKILVSLDVDIIFAMDNDMDEQLSIDMCNRVKRIRKTGYIYDEYKLAGEKASPIDNGLKVFNALYKRIKWVN